MGRGIGESVGHSEGPSAVYNKDLPFGRYLIDVLYRIPRALLVIYILFAGFFLLLLIASQLLTSSTDIAMDMWFYFLITPLILVLVIIPVMAPFAFIMFRFQRVFREYNRVFFQGSNIVIDHTEWPTSPWIRNTIPIASITLVAKADHDYWGDRKGAGTFGERFYYPRHLPPAGGLYHSYSGPEELYIIYLGREQEIETPNRCARLFHNVWSEMVWVKEIVVSVGREDQDGFLRALSQKGVRIKVPRPAPRPTHLERRSNVGPVRFG